MMLEIVIRTAMSVLPLAFVVQFCLWSLRIRRPRWRLFAWTAALIACMAMLAVSSVLFPSSSRATAQPSAPHGPFALLTTAYVFVAALMLLRLMRGLVLSWIMLRATRPLGADWAKGKRLRTSTWIGAPVTIGSHVLLPAECVNWDARRRDAVLAQAAAGVARGDFYVQLLSEVHRSLFWFNPLAWWLHARLIALAELASDDVAIEALDDRQAYAAILRELGRLPTAPLIGVPLARTATVDPRIARIMAQAHPNPAPEEQKESSHEEAGRCLVARDISHRSVVRFRARVGHQDEWPVMPVV
jgi:beta-lactamase regulating signal transducer with metallopeptidase domain